MGSRTRLSGADFWASPPGARKDQTGRKDETFEYDAPTMCGLGQLATENFVNRFMAILVTPLITVEEVERP